MRSASANSALHSASSAQPSYGDHMPPSSAVTELDAPARATDLSMPLFSSVRMRSASANSALHSSSSAQPSYGDHMPPSTLPSSSRCDSDSPARVLCSGTPFFSWAAMTRIAVRSASHSSTVSQPRYRDRFVSSP